VLWSRPQATTHPLGQVQAHRAGQTEDKSYLIFAQPLRNRGRAGSKFGIVLIFGIVKGRYYYENRLIEAANRRLFGDNQSKHLSWI